MKMRISTFFEESLGANLANARWSWGATNPATNQLFLRVWADNLTTIDNNEYVHILSKKWEGTSVGYAERQRHIEMLRSGWNGYGVSCTAKTGPKPGRREIESFDNKILLKLGDLVERDREIYAKVMDRVSVEDLSAPKSNYSSMVPDLRAILSRRGDITTKETLANARVGQGMFRTQVLKLWDSKCCVTGSNISEAIRASHIKPWRDCNNNERLDPANGLPLIATLDALFDAGLISFAEDNDLIVSKRLSQEEQQLLGLMNLKLLRQPHPQTSEYLDHHRRMIFVDNRE